MASCAILSSSSCLKLKFGDESRLDNRTRRTVTGSESSFFKERKGKKRSPSEG